ATEITELKERVKKLEKKGGSRTHRLRRLYKDGRSARVVSSEDEVTTAGEVVTTANVVVSTAEVTTYSTTTTTIDELTLV
ncbi:hypothetical protein Tco_0460664, partial [Tanacetum coccineum]